jgi:S1-C subfamily serine protease
VGGRERCRNELSAGLGLVRMLAGAALLLVGCISQSFVDNLSSSAIIIDPGGYILTNYHVIAGAQRVGVVLPNASKHDAEVITVDEHKDLALLKIEGKDLPIGCQTREYFRRLGAIVFERSSLFLISATNLHLAL